MQTYITSGISAFMGIGTKYTLDIKLHSVKGAFALVEIDTYSFTEFVDEWYKQSLSIIPTVADFFNLSYEHEENQVNVRFVKTFNTFSLKDHAFIALLEDSVNFSKHESTSETFELIARVVHAAMRSDTGAHASDIGEEVKSNHIKATTVDLNKVRKNSNLARLIAKFDKGDNS